MSAVTIKNAYGRNHFHLFDIAREGGTLHGRKTFVSNPERDGAGAAATATCWTRFVSVVNSSFDRSKLCGR
jgi:hypothetical protein